MSRIHEALKRAEQERAARGGFQPVSSGEPSSILQEMPLQSPTAFGNGGATGASFVEAEAFLARWPKLEWKPDTSVMLFMNGNDAARGTEEYRTLRSRLYHLREKGSLKKVLITSALPKEGKSFT